MTRTKPAPSKALGTSTATTVADLEAPGSLRYSVRAAGCDGQESDWLTSPAQQLTLLQEAATSLQYQGAWKTADAANASGGRLRRTTTAGSRLTYLFTGRDVALVAPTCATCSAVRVSIDRGPGTEVSLRSSSAVPRAIHRLATFATSDTHTVTITALARNGLTRVDVDAVIRLG